MKKLSFTFGFILASLIYAHTQVLNPVHWKFSSKHIANNEYELIFNATIDKGWHMYGLNIPENGPIPTSFYFIDIPDINFSSKITPQKKPKIKYDPTFEMDVELFSDQITFTRRVKVPAGKKISVEGSLEFMACDDSRCLPPKEVEFTFELGSKSVQVSEAKSKQLDKQNAEGEKLPALQTKTADTSFDRAQKFVSINNSKPDTAVDEYSTIKTTGTLNEEQSMGDISLLKLFFLAFLAGFAAVITPCVYPVIPLTVSFFMRDTSRGKAIANGLMFGLSIILIYTLIGFLVGVSRVDLVHLISSHWLPNLILFLIFLTLAFSFFGMFEITLPGSLSNKIDQQADKGGFLGPFFMALATVVISFSCIIGFMGSILAGALRGNIVEPTIAMFGFSISFALPFTVLAIFPGLLKSMPKSGGWLNEVKVVFAFILLLFSLVFLGNLRIGFLTREVMLSIIIILFFLLGLYLLGKIRFTHDSPVTSISLLRLMLVIASFSFSLYLITGLFGAPLKSISPFLPMKSSLKNIPMVNRLEVSTRAVGNYTIESVICDENPKYSDILALPLGLKGYFDYEEALNCAWQLNKPVLLDFAGHSCKNCKKMYAEVWSDPQVLTKLKNEFIVAILYTDDRTKLPEEEWITSSIDGKIKNTIGKKFSDLQITKFNSNALPLYAIVNSNGQILTTEKYYTYSPNIEHFLEFLDEGIKNANK